MKRTRISIFLFTFIIMLCTGLILLYSDKELSPSNTTVYLSPRVMALEDTSIGQKAISINNQLSEDTNEPSNCTVIVKPISKNDSIFNDNPIEWNCDNGQHSPNYKQPEVSYIVATFYSSTYYGGSILNFSTRYSGGCTDGSMYILPNLNDIGWGNIISSVDPIDNGGMGCNNAQMWANAYYAGAVYTCYLSCINLDIVGFNNNAESIKVYR